MALVHNEQTKLLANALDRASTACLSIGFLAPTAAVIYAMPTAFPIRPSVIMGVVAWIFASIVLTYYGKANTEEASMSGMELFAFLILPLSIAAAGLAIGFLYGRGSAGDRPHPGE